MKERIQMSDYKKFQEWLSNCPVKIRECEDYTDTIQGLHTTYLLGCKRVLFEITLEEGVI